MTPNLNYLSTPLQLQNTEELSTTRQTPYLLADERTTGSFPVACLGDQWYMLLPLGYPPSFLYRCWRKAIDIIFSLVGLLILLLLFPFLAALIRLDSPGPIFYHQERLGLQGRSFHILKFRSMHVDAERPGVPVWASVGDARVTRVGRFLRSTHLDELPQVVNILRGEMSLIGPRPERQTFVSQLEKMMPMYRCRLCVKPGLTGWAQVKHSYTSTNDDALVKLQYDLYYIKHRSCALDIYIILRTLVAMFLCNGR